MEATQKELLLRKINSNYISFHNNTQKNIKEILVKNF